MGLKMVLLLLQWRVALVLLRGGERLEVITVKGCFCSFKFNQTIERKSIKTTHIAARNIMYAKYGTI